MPRYLISFLDVDPRSGNITHGSVELPFDQPIRTRDEIQEITRLIGREYNLAAPVVMAFSPFAEVN